MIRWITFGVLFLVFFMFFFADILDEANFSKKEMAISMVAIIFTAAGMAFALCNLIFGGAYE